MTGSDPVALFVASDAVLEDALPFLASFRGTNPTATLLLVPGDAGIANLVAAAPEYRFDIADGDFLGLDLLARIVFGDEAAATGRLRWLAAFDVAAPAIVVLDMRIPAPDLTPLFAHIAGAIEPTVAVEPGRLMLGGPSIGSARLLRAVRENLVTLLAAPPAQREAALLDVGLAKLGVRRVRLDEKPPAAPTRPWGEVAGLRDCAEDVRELDNGGAYRRSPPHIVDAPPSLALREHASLAVVVPPPAVVARLQNATVHGRGIVVTQEGCVVRESLINIDPDAPPPLARRPVAWRLGGGPVVLLKQTWDGNYGHWLIESLPRVELVAECRDLARCRFLVGADGGAIGRVYRDSLQLLGIDETQILSMPDETGFCADLIYPAPLTVQPWIKAPRVPRFLERLGEAVSPVSGASPRRLYVSRNRGDRRRLRNESEILPRLIARGYQVVAPELLDFQEQVRMFRQATHVVGNLGAALSNCVFAPRGLRLLALTTEFMQDDFFWDLLAQRGGTYVSLHGKAVDPAAGMQSDFVIDPARLWPLLDALEQGTQVLPP